MDTIRKASLHVGALLPDDATGNSVIAKQEVLLGNGIESLIHCHCNFTPRKDVRVINGLMSAIPALPHLLGSEVHLFEYGFCFDLFRLIRWLPSSARKLVYFHGIAPKRVLPESDRGTMDLSRLQYRLANRADVILHATEYSKQLSMELGVTRPAYIKLPLPIDLPSLSKPPRDGAVIRFLHVGRMTEGKGLLEVLRVLQQLTSNGFPAWSMQVVHSPHTADTAYLEKVEASVRQLGPGSSVSFVGPVSCRLQMAGLYAEADITLLPSRHESYCLPLIESLWAGTPVIAFAAGAIPEVAEGHANLVEPGNLEALATTIRRVALQLPLSCCDRYGAVEREAFQVACRAHFSDLDPAVFGRRLMEIIGDLAGQGRHR